MLDHMPAPPSAPRPLEILANAKVEPATLIAHKAAKEEKPSKTHKSKTIFNWLKQSKTSAATTSEEPAHNIAQINSCQANQLNDHHKIAKKLQLQQQQQSSVASSASAPEALDAPPNACTCSLANEPHNTQPKPQSPHSPRRRPPADETLHEYRGVQTLKHFWNKRITANRESALRAKTAKQRHLFTKSQSCLLNLGPSGEPPPLAASENAVYAKQQLRARSLHDCSQDIEELGVLSDLEIQRHLQKDNFYKYKTAEQASRLRELSESSASRRLSANIILPLVQGYHKSERWIFGRRKSSSAKDPSPSTRSSKLSNHDNDYESSDMASISDLVINDVTSSLPRAPRQAASDSPAKRGHDCHKAGGDHAPVSRNSSSTSLATSQTGSGSQRSASVKRSSSNRKYSFKTHARPYHAPRRMHNPKDNATTGGQTLHHPANSMVAKLTQQFNQMVHKDKALLEEVKRKNGVLLTHKGHVYKVVDTGKQSLSRASSKSLSHESTERKNSSPTTMDNATPSSSVSVQKTIRKFETASRNNAKPKVPLKSLKVLKKSNELVIGKTALRMHSGEVKSCPPQTLMIPSTLEMVKEEAKTPVDAASGDISQQIKKELLDTSHTSTNVMPMTKEFIQQKITEAEDAMKVNETPAQQTLKVTDETNEKDEPLEKVHQAERSVSQQHSLQPSYSNGNEHIPQSPLPNWQPGTWQAQLAKESTDSFFEEIIKGQGPDECNKDTYKTIARKSKLSRKSSIVVDDPQKNIVLYVNENVDRSSRNSENPRDSQLSKTGTLTQKSTLTREQEKLYSNLSKKTKMPEEFAREQTEKLKDLPQAMEVLEDVNKMKALTKEFLSKECKETESGKNLLDLTKADVTMTKELKDKANQEKLLEHEKELADGKNSPDMIEGKKTKNRHSKFYEKIKFFTMSRKNQKSSSSLNLNKAEEDNKSKEDQVYEVPKPLAAGYTPMKSPLPSPKILSAPPDADYTPVDPESKLLYALHQVDEKLQNLSQPASDNVVESDEYGHHIKPNSSFLHQHYAKELPKAAALIQAVNVTLVNNIEGEQMIMEQKEIQQSAQNPPAAADHHISKDEEPLYEPIGCVNHITDSKQSISPLKTDAQAAIAASEVTLVEACNPAMVLTHMEEDIYQTVEELSLKSNEEMSPAIAVTPELPPPPPLPPTAKIPLDDYEVIEDPELKALTLNCNLQLPKHAAEGFDGYEECSPSLLEAISSPILSNATPSPAQYTPSTQAIRKTTDELPDLPKPKRILPKSPMPKRATTQAPTAIAATPASNTKLPASQSAESHYYAGEEEEEEDENIYDTIKGSDCYESLQSVGVKLQKSSSTGTKNSDCVSLTSNCYESISHFKPARDPSHHSNSSHGSTLTISSENKTNSLYEDSLSSTIMQYSSKRIYRTHAETGALELRQSMKSSTYMATYNTSMGRATDTSDEWTDISDAEQDGVDGKDQKPQFILVRAKAHKSPDWSRRVRDKRLHHERKSCSYIEDDDPDHYYEQLSPGALHKRHSLALQERSASLQRNQPAVRVSKRGKQISYSAQALGQEISDDSFDSDTDDYYESEQLKNAHNDSGVDIRTSKLPDPPSSSNQMYAFVRKFKNFIGGHKKTPTSSKHGGSQLKIDDNASQFYVAGNYGQMASQQPPKSSLQVPETKELSTSEKNLILAQSKVTKAEQMDATSTTPRKSKAGKSLRSRLRKSLVGFDSKQLQTLTPTRSTFYVEDPCQPDENAYQLDSGFSEKASSGDIPINAPPANAAAIPPANNTHTFSTLARKSKRETRSSNSQRRRTTIGIRPIEPPPPPPPSGPGAGEAKRQSNTSWYAECGVFKNGTTNLVSDDSQLLSGQNGNGHITSGASWYEEAGLYQTSGVSVASSSGSSGVSTCNEACPTDEIAHSLFSNEPLYQHYTAAKLKDISRDMRNDSSTDGYEEVGERRMTNLYEGGSHRKSARQTALELVAKERGPARTLWSQIPEVVNSMIIPTMTHRERALMEAKFEIITSEASYLKSLNLLRNHFMNHPVFRDQNLVNSRDRKALFAHIVPVHDCCERLLTELESCWQDNIMLIGLSKRIYAVAEKHFHVYVTYCEHQGRMDRTLKRLRAAKGLFSQNLELLEASEACCGLNLHSFLMLPMQRITRLPLLIDAVFSKCDPNDDEYDNWKMCLAIINKIVTQCNEAATKSDQAHEIEKISRQLEFNSSLIRPLAIAPAGVLAPGTKPRFLVKRGEFTHLIWRGDDAKLTFGKKITKTSIYAFLFSDLLVLTKRKGEEQFSVFDYCPRNMLTITSGDTLPQLPTKDFNSQSSKNLILMTLLENHERKTNELVLSCPSVSEQERWLQAMRPPESETPGEKLYEQWDCPQVMAKHSYENNEPDGLSLEVGDVVNVTRKLPDGWYQGERIRDGVIGWFPESYTEEVNSAHVRARNLKLRHRLLTFTATYLESQKRNK